MELFQEAAQYYNEQNIISPNKYNQSIFFFRVNLEHSKGVFQELQITSVPRIYIIPPRDENSKKSPFADYEISTNFLYQKNLQLFLNEIKESTDISVRASRNMCLFCSMLEYHSNLSHPQILLTVDPKPFLLLLSIMAFLVALFASSFMRDIGSSIFWYQKNFIWVCVSLVRALQ